MTSKSKLYQTVYLEDNRNIIYHKKQVQTIQTQTKPKQRGSFLKRQERSQEVIPLQKPKDSPIKKSFILNVSEANIKKSFNPFKLNPGLPMVKTQFNLSSFSSIQTPNVHTMQPSQENSRLRIKLPRNKSQQFVLIKAEPILSKKAAQDSQEQKPMTSFIRLRKNQQSQMQQLPNRPSRNLVVGTIEDQKQKKFTQLMNVNYDEKFRELENNISRINIDKIIRKNRVKVRSVKFLDDHLFDYS